MRPALEVADIVRAHGDEFRQVHATSLSTRQKRICCKWYGRFLVR
jgi:hypothetical protein